MGKSQRIPLSRTLAARLAAVFGIITAASWGPLSNTLKLIETSEQGESSIRVVLAQSYSLERAAKSKQPKPATTTDSKTQAPQTERILNAVPDNLESAHSVHFDLEPFTAAPQIAFFIGAAETRHAVYAFELPPQPPPDRSLPRGPPAA